jgi:hypothetical protein
MVWCNLSRRLFADTLVKVGDRRAQSSRDFEQSSGGYAIDATLIRMTHGEPWLSMRARYRAQWAFLDLVGGATAGRFIDLQ